MGTPLGEQSSIQGWVYIVTNKALPGLVKIGFTTRQDVNTCLKEFDQAGLPYPYEITYKVWVPEPQELEHSVHQVLDIWRENREWFRCSADRAQYAIELLTPDHTEKWTKLEPSSERNNDSAWPGYSEAPNAAPAKKAPRNYKDLYPLLLIAVLVVGVAVYRLSPAWSYKTYAAGSFTCVRGEGLEFYILDTGPTDEIRVCRNERFLGGLVRQPLYGTGRYSKKPWVMNSRLQYSLRIPGYHPGFDSESQAVRFVKNNLRK